MIFALAGLGVLTACAPAMAAITPAPTPMPSAVPWASPTSMWPLVVHVEERGTTFTPTACNKLMQLVPGQSTLEDLYRIVGYPSWKRDFQTGVALRYASGDMKWNHVVVVDGVTGVVALVAIVAKPRIRVGPAVTCVDVAKLKGEYGVPQLVSQSNGGWSHLLFENQGLGLMDDTYSQIVQLLPPGTKMAEYKSHSGYGQESIAFTP